MINPQKVIMRKRVGWAWAWGRACMHIAHRLVLRSFFGHETTSLAGTNLLGKWDSRDKRDQLSISRTVR